jgi:hypothetical protein
LQSRLRHIVAPALRPLLGPGRVHATVAVVIELAHEKRIGLLARPLSPRSAEMIAQALPDLVPEVLRHDWRLLAFVNLAFVGNATCIDRVRKDLVDVPPAEQAAPGRAATAVDADRNPNPLSVELLFEAHHR